MHTPTPLSVFHKTWGLLAVGPLLFFLSILGASVFFGIQGVPAVQIPEQVASLVSHIILAVLLCLAVLLTALLRPQVKATWRLPGISRSVQDISIGLLAGALSATIYLHWLVPFHTLLQRTAGDFVSPGAVLPAVSHNISVFLIANVFLAPLVEETLYRGIAIPALAKRLGQLRAVVITCVFFGLLHWTGGVWYMLLTGFFAGGIFACLFIWRKGILAPFSAHLALNFIEFLYMYHSQPHGT